MKTLSLIAGLVLTSSVAMAAGQWTGTLQVDKNTEKTFTITNAEFTDNTMNIILAPTAKTEPNGTIKRIGPKSFLFQANKNGDPMTLGTGLNLIKYNGNSSNYSSSITLTNKSKQQLIYTGTAFKILCAPHHTCKGKVKITLNNN